MAEELIRRAAPKIVRTYHDKSSWGPGPWQSEPDEVRWSDSSTGIRCVLMRARGLGVWMGSCGLPGNHPWERLKAEDIPTGVHGGITAKAVVMGDGSGMTWIGFGCAGPRDFAPGVTDVPRGQRLIYRDQWFAKIQVLRLAVEIVLATGPGAWWEGAHG